VSKAHRKYYQPPAVAEIFNDVMPNFTFSAESLAPYDVIWLIGSGGPDEPIADSEVAAIAQFMAQGGGVFATGDHKDYGSAMGSLLPRVGDMRLWTLADAPSDLGPTRITTIPPTSAGLQEAINSLHLQKAPPMDALGNALPSTLPSGVNLVPFENQSADVPAPIFPKFYVEFSPNNRSHLSFTVHPLMAMDDGSFLDGLPGHMHEGLVPPPGAPASYVGNANYPSKDGVQPIPDVVAKGECLAQFDWPQYNDIAFDADYSIPTSAGYYGVTGAYDGWSVGVGRVAVDSTFHHFMDINLIGDQDCVGDDPRAAGYSTASGQAALAKIHNYHRNLVFWLGHTSVVVARLGGILTGVMDDPGLRAAAETAPDDSYAQLGVYASIVVAANGMPVSHAFDALLAITNHRVLPPWFCGNPGDRVVLSPNEARHIFSSALGSALVALYAKEDALGGNSVGRDEIVSIVRDGLKRGMDHAVARWPADLPKLSTALANALRGHGVAASPQV
jgi:hypothetical protein